MSFDTQIVASRLRELSYLNPGVRFTLAVETPKQVRTTEFYSEHGIPEFALALSASSRAAPLYTNPIHFRKEFQLDGHPGIVEVAILHNSGYSSNTPSFVNSIFTPDGGTHVAGVRAGILKAINKYVVDLAASEAAKKGRSLGKKLPDAAPEYTGADIEEGLVAVVALKIRDPQFKGQTKGQLTNSGVLSRVTSITFDHMLAFLLENPAQAALVVEKANTAQRAREASDRAKKASREEKKSADLSLLKGKLTDCSLKIPERCELFLVEGDSAGGSAVQGRDHRYQAILPLKGKILNTARGADTEDSRKGLAIVQRNAEIDTIISALGCGVGESFNISKLRYHKIIIMTDADVYGSHIRSLLLTLLFNHMRPVIEAGMVYSAQPPLYRVGHNKRSTGTYLADDRALDQYLSTVGVQKLQIFDPATNKVISPEGTSGVVQVCREYLRYVSQFDSYGIDPAAFDFGARFLGPGMWSDYLQVQQATVAVQQCLVSTGTLVGPVLDWNQLSAPGFQQTLGVCPTRAPSGELGIHVRERHKGRLREYYLHQGVFTGTLPVIEYYRGLFAAQGITWNSVGIQMKDVRNVHYNLFDFLEVVDKMAKEGSTIQRYKGLGEMDPQQLWETTMDPDNRTLRQITIGDLSAATNMVELLMGNNVAPRKDFIMEYGEATQGWA